MTKAGDQKGLTLDPEQVSRLQSEHDELSAIVCELAKSPDYYMDEEGGERCQLCGASCSGMGRGVPHKADCPHRRAVEWCKQHPEVK